MTDHGVQPIVEASAGLESVITELYEKSGNSGLSREQFAAVLNEVAAKYLPADASARQTAELCCQPASGRAGAGPGLRRRSGTGLGNLHGALPREAL